MQTITVTELRKDIYNLIDKVLKTGTPLEIKRKGQKVKIVADKPVDKLSKIKGYDSIVGDPDDLINLKVWEWNEEKNL